VRIEVLWPSYPVSNDYWDGNWLETRIRVVAGGFKGHYRAQLRSEEFADFRAALYLLYTSLGTDAPVHEAAFQTMEEQLSISVKGDRQGHFSAHCVAVDRAGTGNRLECELAFDQTQLPAMVEALDALITAFPVKGRAVDT